MFKLLKFLAWTACAIGLGIFLAKGQIDGRTPLEHLERFWKHKVNPSKLDQLKDGLGEAIDKVAERPRDRYSDDERAAIDRIIAKSPTQR
ncbi:MAG: hypothetical protein IRZ16_09425 [Myxococcaceae bacterium]|nr:hypothetical protein [Myxococcaceae bacterium]